jgi:hypothetical protein
MSVIPEIKFKELLEEEKFNLPVRFVSENPGEYSGNFPVVVKISSEKIVHKTEAGAVITDIKSREELIKTYKDMSRKFPGETIYVEEMAKRGTEIIIGMINDPSFGKMILLGIGGFFSELINDVTFKKVPIDIFDAEDMISELKYSRLLDGYRGFKASKDIVKELLLKVSDFGLRTEFSQIDLNPVFLYEDHYLIVDAKMIV